MINNAEEISKLYLVSVSALVVAIVRLLHKGRLPVEACCCLFMPCWKDSLRLLGIQCFYNRGY